jgi:hypothetical protein
MKTEGGIKMGKTVSEKLRELQIDIINHAKKQPNSFYLGEIYGQLGQIIQTVTEEEKALKLMSQLVYKLSQNYKPEMGGEE